MRKPRQSDEDLTPTSEDQGIFKGSIVTVQLHITPLRRVTKRDDLLCVGFQGDKRIEVLIPGRRRFEANSLEMALDEFAREKAKKAASMGIPAPHAVSMRFPVEVQGVWRVRLDEDQEDEIERVYQFMVGRWAFSDSKGNTIVAGETPIQRPITRMPVF